MARRTVLALLTAIVVLGAAPAASSAATRTVCASGCDFTTIGAAVAAADPGDTIDVGAGTFAGGVTIDKPLTIVGAGPDQTTVTAATVFTVGPNADGTRIENLHVQGSTATGTSFGVTATAPGVDDLTLRRLLVTRARHGIDVRDTATADGWEIDDVVATGNNLAARFWGPTTNLTITGSEFTGNDYGLYSQYRTVGGVRTPGVFDGVTVTDTSFSGNSTKGIYLEAASDALFSNIVVDATGSIPEVRPSGPPSYPIAGVDVNVKYGTFANVRFEDSRVTSTRGTAMTLKGRNDAPSYSAIPATLQGLELEGMTITGSTDSGHAEARGHGIALGYNVVAPRIEASRIVGNAAGGLLSYVTAPTTVTATDVWWGCNGGPAGAGCDAVTVEPGGAPVQSDPWVVLGVDLGQAWSYPGDAIPVAGTVARDSAGGPVTGLPEQQIALQTSVGTLSNEGGWTTGGTVGATFTSYALGTATVTATLDGATASQPIALLAAPAPQPEPTPTPAPQPPPTPGPVVVDQPSTNPPAATPRAEAREELGRRVVEDPKLDLGEGASAFLPATSRTGRVRVPRRGDVAPLMALVCEQPCEALVEQRLTIDGRERELATQRLRLTAGEAAAVELPLTRAQRRALRRAGGGRLEITVTLTRADGSRTTSSRTLRLRVPRA